MLLPIFQYGDPVLRQRGLEIQKVTSAIRKLAQNMVETMHAVHGIGLAAQQIGQAIQLTVIDIRGSDQPSQLFPT